MQMKCNWIRNTRNYKCEIRIFLLINDQLFPIHTICLIYLRRIECAFHKKLFDLEFDALIVFFCFILTLTVLTVPLLSIVMWGINWIRTKAEKNCFFFWKPYDKLFILKEIGVPNYEIHLFTQLSIESDWFDAE